MGNEGLCVFVSLWCISLCFPWHGVEGIARWPCGPVFRRASCLFPAWKDVFQRGCARQGLIPTGGKSDLPLSKPRHPPARPGGDLSRHCAGTDPPAGPGDDGERAVRQSLSESVSVSVRNVYPSPWSSVVKTFHPLNRVDFPDGHSEPPVGAPLMPRRRPGGGQGGQAA